MIILSIDSGIERTGFAVFDKSSQFKNGFKLITSGRILTNKKNILSDRLHEIFIEINKLIDKHKPEHIVLERLFFFKNQKTIISVGQAQGIVLLICAQNNIKVEFLSPLQIKEIVTGYGRADKIAVQKMLKLTLGISLPKTHDDEADAIACGLAYCYMNKNIIE
jgi:crossover junction endodeoxyribonuclease RuvC